MCHISPEKRTPPSFASLHYNELELHGTAAVSSIESHLSVMLGCTFQTTSLSNGYSNNTHLLNTRSHPILIRY